MTIDNHQIGCSLFQPRRRFGIPIVIKFPVNLGETAGHWGVEDDALAEPV